MATPTAAAPHLGAIIIYVDPHMADKYPAIVTQVLTEGRVLATVFQPGNTPFPAVSPRIVPFDPEGKQPGSWHWKEDKLNGRK